MRKIYLYLILIFLVLGTNSSSLNKKIHLEIPEYIYVIQKHFLYDQLYNTKNDLNPVIKSDFESLTIPVKRAGNLILIETVIDGMNGNLIFDSGSSSELVLNKTYFRNYKRKGSKSVTGVSGTIQTIDIIEVDSLILNEMVFKEVDCETLDLSKIENRINNKILGFFGLQLLENNEIIIDLLNDQIQLFSLDRKGNRIKTEEYAEQFDFTQKIEIFNNVIFLWADVAGKDILFCFDTAAEKNILSYTAPKKVINSIIITGRAKMIGAGSGHKEVLLGEMTDFMIGEKPLKNMETLIADISALSLIYETYVSGVLGYDFLLQGKISLNLKKKEFRITFNKES